jgi:hypothetical protein
MAWSIYNKNADAFIPATNESSYEAYRPVSPLPFGDSSLTISKPYVRSNIS